jgi:hypothetical protein
MDLKSGTALNLLECAASQLIDDPAHWPAAGKLRLIGFKYKSIAGSEMNANERLRWLRLQYPLPKKLPFSLQPYRQLAGVLREHGLDDDARAILMGMEDDRRKHAGLSRRQKALSCGHKAILGYGQKPFQALWWLGGLWLLGLLVFGGAYQHGRLAPAQREAFNDFVPAHAAPAYYEKFCAPVYSLDVILPLVNLGQRDAWRPLASSETALSPPTSDPDWRAVICGTRSSRALSWLARYTFVIPALERVPRLFHWFLIIAGWFLASMFALGITGLVRRE